MLFKASAVPTPASTTLNYTGCPALVLGGCSAVAHTQDATSRFTRLPRVTYAASSTAVNALMTLRQNVLWLPCRTDEPNSAGGFYFRARFSIDDYAAYGNNGSRMFFGLRDSTTALTGVDPATLTNCIGVGHNSGDEFLYFYYGGSTAQARIPTTIGLAALRRFYPLELVVNYFRISLAAWYCRATIMMVTGDNPSRPEPPSSSAYTMTAPVDSLYIPTSFMTLGVMRQKLSAVGTVAVGIHALEAKIFM